MNPSSFSRTSQRYAAVIIISLAFAIMFAGCQRRTPEDRLQKAQTLYQQRDLLGATFETKELIKRFPDDPRAVDAHLLLSQIYFQERRFDDAVTELKIVLNKLSQRDQRGQFALRGLLEALQQQKRFKEALEVIDEYQQKYADDEGVSLSLTVGRANVLTRAEETTQAREILFRLKENTTSTAELELYRDLIGQTYTTEGNTTSAIDFYIEEFNRVTSPVEKGGLAARAAIGFAAAEDYENTRKWTEEATTAFDTAMGDELNADTRAQLAYELATLYQRVGNLPGAQQVLRRLFDAPSRPDTLAVVANDMLEVLLRRGNIDEAIAFMRDAARLFPQSPLAQRANDLENLKTQGRAEQEIPRDTTPLVLKFEEDARILVPTNLPTSGTVSAATDTTETASAAAPEGTLVTTDSEEDATTPTETAPPEPAAADQTTTEAAGTEEVVTTAPE
jgi:tetratricopeptide (TPR) repeat protein